MFAVRENRPAHVLITGGAGFIGTNLAAHLLGATDARITLFDNLSHPGADANLAWLRSQARADRLRFLRGDVRSRVRVAEVMRDADEVYHLAAHFSEEWDSRDELDVNVTGTLQVLEAARRCERKPVVLYVSSSQANGGSQEMAERSVLDYARFYEVPAVVLRADTVAGARQFESPGHHWVAHCVYAVLEGRPVRVEGGGTEAHDVLHVSDLIAALEAARDFRAVTAGHAYHVGGGIAHSVSVNEMIALIERVCHRAARVEHVPERTDAGPSYIADPSAFMAATGWRVRRSVEQTVREVAAFWHANRMQMHNAAQPAQHSFRHAA